MKFSQGGEYRRRASRKNCHYTQRIISGLTAAIDLAYLVLRYCQARPAYPNVIKMIVGEWENIEANGMLNATQKARGKRGTNKLPFTQLIRSEISL